jgi:hypothetical protein
MNQYAQGHVKHDPDSGAVAIRTGFSESDPQLATMAWLVATSSMGARHSTTELVAGWDDLFTPDD